MFKLLRKSSDSAEIRFCDRCSSVCDQRSQADAIYERARDQRLLYGWRLS